MTTRRLDRFVWDTGAGLKHPAQRRNAQYYVEGLLSATGPKTMAGIVDALGGGHSEYESLQQFISHSPWDAHELTTNAARTVIGLVRPTALVATSIQVAPDTRHYDGGVIDVLLAVGRASAVPIAWSFNEFNDLQDHALELVPPIPVLGRGAQLPDHVRDKLSELGHSYVLQVFNSQWWHLVSDLPPGRHVASPDRSGFELLNVPTRRVARTLHWVESQLRESGRFRSSDWTPVAGHSVTNQPDPERTRKELILFERPANLPWPRCWLSNSHDPSEAVALVRSLGSFDRVRYETTSELVALGISDSRVESEMAIHHHCALATLAFAFSLHARCRNELTRVDATSIARTAA